MGGSLFSEYLGPLSITADHMYVCPASDGDTIYTAPCTGNATQDSQTTQLSTATTAAARSRHPTGVNTVLADGSTQFVTDDINLQVWQALGTRAGALTQIEPLPSFSAPHEIARPADLVAFGNRTRDHCGQPSMMSTLADVGVMPVKRNPAAS